MAYPTTRKFQARNGKTAACGKCGKEIVKGERYVSVQYGFRGSLLVRCTASACEFKRSEYTASKLAGVYAASEQAHDAIDALTSRDVEVLVEDLESILNECAEAWREVAAEYQDAADNMQGGLGEQMQERVDAVESAADTLESTSLEATAPEACSDHDDIDADCADCQTAVDEAVESLREEARMAIDGAEGEVG